MGGGGGIFNPKGAPGRAESSFFMTGKPKEVGIQEGPVGGAKGLKNDRTYWGVVTHMGGKKQRHILREKGKNKVGFRILRGKKHDGKKKEFFYRWDVKKKRPVDTEAGKWFCGDSGCKRA